MDLSTTSSIDFKYQFTTAKGSFELVPLTKDNLEETINVTVKAFISFDPAIIVTGCSEDSFRTLAKLVAHRSSEDGLGIVCAESNTGKVVGAALSNDYYNSEIKPFDLSVLTDGLGDLFSIPDNISLSDEFKVTGPLQAVELFFLCVDSDYANQRIGTEILQYFMAGHPLISKTNDVFAYCSSPWTCRMTAKLGWQKLDVHDIKLYEKENGVRPFEKIEEIYERLGFPVYQGEGVVLMRKKLK